MFHTLMPVSACCTVGAVIHGCPRSHACLAPGEARSAGAREAQCRHRLCQHSGPQGMPVPLGLQLAAELAMPAEALIPLQTFGGHPVSVHRCFAMLTGASVSASLAIDTLQKLLAMLTNDIIRARPRPNILRRTWQASVKEAASYACLTLDFKGLPGFEELWSWPSSAHLPCTEGCSFQGAASTHSNFVLLTTRGQRQATMRRMQCP